MKVTSGSTNVSDSDAQKYYNDNKSQFQQPERRDVEVVKTKTQAQAELTSIAADLQRAHPDTNKQRGLSIRTELQARIAQSPPATCRARRISSRT